MLHIHSNYSLLRGTSTIEDIVSFAVRMQFKSLALTDTNSMQGLIQISKALKAFDIKPVLGTQLTFSSAKDDYVLLYAKNRDGYNLLCRLITQKKLDDNFCFSNLAESVNSDLFCLTPSLTYFEILYAKNKGSVYYEIVLSEYSIHTTQIKGGLPDSVIIATCPVYFTEKQDFMLHKIVSAIRERKTVDTLGESEIQSESSYLNRYFDILQESIPPEWINNADKIYKGCNVELEIGKYKFPDYSVPDGESSDSFLWRLSYGGMKQRYKEADSGIINRLEYELSVIKELNFANYFLVVWDIVNEAKKRGMMMIGRGSAANSLVSYCLGFTEVDPIKYDLYFERFLNRSRTSPPDVDLDFSWKERDEIIKYVFEKYGYGRVAMISTTVTFRARSAFRETAKVFGFSDEQISQHSKFIPWTSAKNLERLDELFPESKNLPFSKEPWRTVISYASRLAGFPRHLGIHPGGIIISPDNITNYTALEYASNKGIGIIVTQPDMHSIEDLGLVKIDLLSQRSLGVVRSTLTGLNSK